MLITHDFAYEYGGAERVTEAIAEAFPEASVAVIGGNAAVLERMGVRERTRSLLPLGRFADAYRFFSPVYPLVLPIRQADVVISSSYAFAHHVRARRLHVEYCHSPLRQIWISYDGYRRKSSPAVATGMRLFRRWLQRMDTEAIRRVDVVVASCENVRRRVADVYGRESTVVYPPVDVDRFAPSPVERDGDLVLIVARLVEPYKAVKAALDAFQHLPYRLAVAGGGRDEATLRAAASPNVRFLGRLGDRELRDWYSRASVVLFPGEDDFGIVPIEAMACGTPVVALDAGGARETIVHGRTGVLFRAGEMEDALRGATARAWNHDEIRANAMRFARRPFVDRIKDLLERAGR